MIIVYQKCTVDPMFAVMVQYNIITPYIVQVLIIPVQTPHPTGKQKSAQIDGIIYTDPSHPRQT